MLRLCASVIVARSEDSMPAGSLRGGAPVLDLPDIVRKRAGVFGTLEAIHKHRASERRERASRSERAGEAASESASRGVRGAKPLDKNWRRRDLHLFSSSFKTGENARVSGQTADVRHFRRLRRFPLGLLDSSRIDR